MKNKTVTNRLLAYLSAEDWDAMALKKVVLSTKQTIYEEDASLKYVYFIEQGLASVIMNMADGSAVEVGMMGFEGMIGASALLGAKFSTQHIIIQADGAALRANVEACRAVFDKNARFRGEILRFVEYFLNVISQTAACNRLHAVEERCARWLLMSTERVQSDRIPMTHEFLSSLLGVRRAGVTVIAGSLKRSGLIRYHHGTLTVIDRKGLEGLACECYLADKKRYKAIMGK